MANAFQIASVRGLSPWVRGKLFGEVNAGGGIGSIPVGAGETQFVAASGCRLRVYPRGCGGN